MPIVICFSFYFFFSNAFLPSEWISVFPSIRLTLTDERQFVEKNENENERERMELSKKKNCACNWILWISDSKSRCYFSKKILFGSQFWNGGDGEKNVPNVDTPHSPHYELYVWENCIQNHRPHSRRISSITLICGERGVRLHKNSHTNTHIS